MKKLLLFFTSFLIIVLQFSCRNKSNEGELDFNQNKFKLTKKSLESFIGSWRSKDGKYELNFDVNKNDILLGNNLKSKGFIKQGRGYYLSKSCDICDVYLMETDERTIKLYRGEIVIKNETITSNMSAAGGNPIRYSEIDDSIKLESFLGTENIILERVKDNDEQKLITDNEQNPDKKTLKMVFNEYYEGDMPHFIFKDIISEDVYDFRHISDNKLTIPILLDDENMSFGLKSNPSYLKKIFIVDIEKKEILDNDMEGNTIKVKDWVITNIIPIDEQEKSNTSNKNFLLKGKIIVSETQGNAFYRILVKEIGDSLHRDEYDFHLPYTIWSKVKFYKNGKLLSNNVENLKEGIIIGIIGTKTISSDTPIMPTEIHIL